jgi:hypothetical protein
MTQNKYLLKENVNKQFELYTNIFKKLEEKVRRTPYNKRISIIKDYIQFDRIFGSKGVQGIVGLVKIKGLPDTYPPVVFKVSNEINRSIEHEHLILDKLNKTRDYCPHFVRTLGKIEMPISTLFIQNPDNKSLFYEDDETLPYTVMFLEYANKYPFYKICQLTDNKNIVSSQILQVLLSLEIGQVKNKFTHYDLHTSNILLQLCEKNSIFLYKIKNKYYHVPTFGFFPLIIDTGISYSQCIDKNMMMTTTYNYDHGFQSAMYDHLNDIHHFLLTSFYYIESDTDLYETISNKIKIIFRHLPVLRKSGWKRLPHNLSKSVIDKIKEDCKTYKKYDIFCEYEYNSIDILNGLISLPFQNKGKIDFKTCFPEFMIEYSRIIDIEDFSENDVLFVLKTIVDCIYKHKQEYINGIQLYAVEQFKKELKSTISEILSNNVNYDIDYEILMRSGIELGNSIESIYYELSQEHLNIINDCYEKTIVKSPVDMYTYLSQNMTPYFNIDNETIVYYWNCDEEYSTKTSCTKLSVSSISEINSSPFTEKANKIAFYLSLLKN